MKHFKKFALVALMVCSAAFISCDDDEEDAYVDNCGAELQALSTTLSQKSTAFSNNPNSTTCAALRQAAINLLNKAQACDAAGQYQQAVQVWVSMDCSVYD